MRRADLRLHEGRLLDEVRQTVRDGVLAAHPWLRYPLPERRAAAVEQVQRPPIPFRRVQQLVRDLLGQDDLSNVRSLEIGFGAIRAEVCALDAAGRKYGVRMPDGDMELAVDVIHIPVSR